MLEDIMTKESEKLTTIQQIKKLDEERATLLESAKTDALARAEEAIGELNELGFDYELIEKGPVGTKKPRRVKSAAADKGERHAPKGECPICQFTTEPPHDRRSHRRSPKPFTASQLTERGMTKV